LFVEKPFATRGAVFEVGLDVKGLLDVQLPIQGGMQEFVDLRAVVHCETVPRDTDRGSPNKTAGLPTGQ
jgi:hypothetical protein